MSEVDTVVVFCQLDILDERNSIEEFLPLQWPIDVYVEFVLNGRPLFIVDETSPSKESWVV